MKNLNVVIGKVINSVFLGTDDALHFVFSDGTKMKLSDEEGICCERRYMTVEDDLSFVVGSKLISIEVRNAPNIESEDDVHEVQFLEVMTSRGSFTVVTHNEHNGYYSGFCVCIEIE